MSRVLTVARNDLKNARRSKLLWFVVGSYGLFALLLFWSNSQSPRPSVNQALFGMTGVGALLVPLIALVSAYLAVAGERDRGTIKLRLGLPNTRAEVLAGKFLSRTALVAAALLVALVVAVGAGVAFFEDPDFSSLPAFAGVTLAFTLAYVGIAVGLSAGTASRSRAMGASIGYFFVFNVLWILGSFNVIGALRFVLEDTLGLSLADSFYEFVWQLSPVASYLKSLSLVFERSEFRQLPEAPDEWFLQPEVAVVVLVAWLVVPVALGYWRFRRADLG